MESSAISHLATPDFDTIRAMTAEDASKPVVDILRTMETADERIESLTRQVYALRGASMKIAEEKQIFKCFIDEEVGQPFRSLDRWNKVTFPKSHRYNQEALATILKLPDVPLEALVNMPRCNIMALTQTSSNVRTLPESSSSSGGRNTARSMGSESTRRTASVRIARCLRGCARGTCFTSISRCASTPAIM